MKHAMMMLALAAIGGCSAEALPDTPPFEFVCRKDGAESLRLHAYEAVMRYDPGSQTERWDVEVDQGGGLRSNYRHTSGPGEVCNPQLQPLASNMD